MAETLVMSAEEHSAMERRIQIGAPDEMLAIGITVGKYREQVWAREREADKRTTKEEADSTRSQAAIESPPVRVSLEEGRLISSPLAVVQEKEGEDLSELKVDDLKLRAELAGVKDFSAMKKSELIAALGAKPEEETTESGESAEGSAAATVAPDPASEVPGTVETTESVQVGEQVSDASALSPVAKSRRGRTPAE